MKTSDKIIILMITAIALILLSNFITLPNQNKLKIKIDSQKAVKTNTGKPGECLFKLSATITNEGKKFDDATFIVKMVKDKQVQEEDKFQIGKMNKFETKSFMKNYTRACDYLTNFNISFSK